MSDSVSIEGEDYISSKRASKETGYTQDYIGQLARAGAITARRVGGHWYISSPSLRAYKSKADEYKPQPPQYVPSAPEAEQSISLEGKEYISAASAAKLSGYHQDYVGQLARSGKIASRQVGNRWFIDRDSLLSHKNEKDSLLAEVQTHAVGLPRSTPPSQIVRAEQRSIESPDPFFTYSAQAADLMPNLSPHPKIVPPVSPGVRTRIDGNALYERQEFSRPRTQLAAAVHTLPTPQRYVAPKKKRRRLVVPLSGVALTIVVIFTFGFTSLRERALYAVSHIRADNSAQGASSGSVGEMLRGVIERVGEIFSHELHYTAKRK